MPALIRLSPSQLAALDVLHAEARQRHTDPPPVTTGLTCAVVADTIGGNAQSASVTLRSLVRRGYAAPIPGGRREPHRYALTQSGLTAIRSKAAAQ